MRFQKQFHYISNCENLTSAKINYMTEKSHNVERETQSRRAFYFCEFTEKFYCKQT